MRICIISDIHADITPWDWSCLDGFDADAVVFAGDASNHVQQTCLWVEQLRKRYPRVVWVAGNHDFYNLGFNETRLRHAGEPPPPHTVAEMVLYYQQWSTAHDVDFLHRSSVTIQGMNFVGATGWHNYVAGTPLSTNSQIDAWYHSMRDTVIPWQGYDKPDHTQPAIAGAADVQALQSLVNQLPGPIVVVTHHLPRRELCWQRRQDTAWTALHGSFANTAMESIHDEKIKLWIYGHTHRRGVNTINGQEYVCNARGYPGENNWWQPVLVDVNDTELKFV